jgi:hypothetical protein
MSERAPVEFEVVAADSGTEIFLIDGHFKLLKKGIGRERFSVPTGIYKIKARSGKTATEKMLIVRAGMEPVKLDPVKLSSAMPLLHSAKTHEFHMLAARQAAAAPTLVLGSGSAIVVVVRQWTAAQPTNTTTAVPPNPALGLTLRDMSGAVIVDIEHQTSVSTTFDPCVTLHVALNPGAYRLALAYENGRHVEQTLITCDGWQTHIYLLVDNNVDSRQARADVVNGAITMRKPGQGFNEDDPTLRLEEIARGALVDDRKILSDDFRFQIARRDCSPMLALLGAHLLIREGQDAKARQEEAPDDKTPVVDNRPQVRTIVDNLRASIGAHPDVEAIAIGAGNQDASFAFVAPPLFRASWRLLLKASAQQPELLPAGSFGARVAERIWGEGAWLLWLAPDAPDTVDRSTLWQARARELLASIEAKPSGTTADRAATIPTGTIPPLPIPTLSTPTEAVGGLSGAVSIVLGLAASVLSRLKSLFATRSRTPFPDLREGVQRAVTERAAVDLTDLRARLTDDQWRSLIKAVGVPMSSINAWLDKLNE